MEQEVILVNDKDEQTGTMKKLQAHQLGVLHRAFSVFIFNSRGEMLLQRRAQHKYHSAGLWTNTCCSHPHPGESTSSAAERRLKEELGFTTPLTKAFEFIYQSTFENGLTEYEFDHVLVGYYDGPVKPDTNEVSEFSYLPVEEIERKLASSPAAFTAWFSIAFPKLREWIRTSRLTDQKI